MGLLWTFMGASESYTIFSGISEMAGGLLVTARRTTLLGALVCIGVLGNIVMLNFSYDVPVKLLSCHLFAMAMFWPHPISAGSRSSFSSTSPLSPRPSEVVAWKWPHGAVIVVRTALVIAFTSWVLVYSYDIYTKYGAARPGHRSTASGTWRNSPWTVKRGCRLSPIRFAGVA